MNSVEHIGAAHMHDAILNKELGISWKNTDSAKSSGKGGGQKKSAAKSRKMKYKIFLSQYEHKPKA